VPGAREEFVHAWDEFADAFERRDHPAGLAALQRWIVAWDRCFWANEIDVFSHVYVPDVVVVSHLPFPGFSGFRGIEGFARGRAEVADVASNFRFDVTELVWRGTRFAGLGRMRARGRYTGLVLRFPNAVVWTYAARKINRIEIFASHRRARRLVHNHPPCREE
jgi:hypothetical protein